MIRNLLSRSLLCGALSALAVLGVMHEQAEAAPVKVRFTPPYGSPFPNLEWFGEAVVDDGTCAASGSVSNLFGPCSGQFSFVSATVNFADVTAPTTVLETLNFTGATVVGVDRSSPAPADWTAVYSSPFTPIKGTIAQTLYGADNAYFSLIFVGGYAQLYWFKDNPGDALSSYASALTYIGCYAAGPGDHSVLGNRCGLSSNLDNNANGATLTITAVPEPSAYAMMVAGLGALMFIARRRARRS